MQDVGYGINPSHHVDHVLKALGKVPETNGSLKHTWMLFLIKNVWGVKAR